MWYRQSFRFSVVACYAWLAAVSFGVILLDVSYANRLRAVLGNAESAVVFSNVSDALLLAGAVTICAALGSIGLSWESRITRYLLLASLVCLMSEFVVPVMFASFVQNAQTPSAGPFLRITFSGLVSVFAFIALHKIAEKG